MGIETGILAAIIGAAASGGAQVINGVVQSKSNNKSAQLQTAAANHATDVQAQAEKDALAAQKEEQAYERQQTAAQQQARAPYVALGNSSLAALAGRLGVPAPNFSSTSMPATPTTQTATAQSASSATQSAALPSVGSLASIYQPAMPASAAMNKAQLTASQTPTTGTGGVKMIAPTGETAIVAPKDVARAVSQGARVA